MIPITITKNGELAVNHCTCSGTAMSAEPGAIGPNLVINEAETGRKPTNSYGQILKSSALVGGSQVANIAIGIVRTKAMAMLLGPAGFGLFGLYWSIANLVQSVAGMGINSSGVRQIAEAVGTGSDDRIAQTTAVLRRTSVVLGLLGGGFLLLFCRQVSRITFGATDRAGALALLSLVVFFTLVAGGQAALIQGMRRIADLARMNVLGAFFGLCASIPLVYFFRQKGVVPSLLSVAVMTVLTSWWYSRKVRVQPASLEMGDIARETSSLLKLGFVFMSSGLMTLGVAYVVRVIILRRIGFEATGFYQSAWTLGGLYISFILQAMGADFYPRLTASANDNAECNRLVNEQTLVGLLLAAPGVIGTLTFAPLVISLFYSAKFGAAVPILRWICLGAMLQVVTWPMGFIIVAKARKALFFFAEFAWTVVAIALAWSCVRYFGLAGAGIAFFGSYVFHAILIYPMVRHLSGFRWSATITRTGLVFMPLIAIVFCAFYALPMRVAVPVGAIGLVASCVYSVRTISRLIPAERLPRPLRRLVGALGFVPRESAAGA